MNLTWKLLAIAGIIGLAQASALQRKKESSEGEDRHHHGHHGTDNCQCEDLDNECHDRRHSFDPQCFDSRIKYAKDNKGCDFAMISCGSSEAKITSIRSARDLLAHGYGVEKVAKCKNGRWEARDLNGYTVRVRHVTCHDGNRHNDGYSQQSGQWPADSVYGSPLPIPSYPKPVDYPSYPALPPAYSEPVPVGPY